MKKCPTYEKNDLNTMLISLPDPLYMMSKTMSYVLILQIMHFDVTTCTIDMEEGAYLVKFYL